MLTVQLGVIRGTVDGGVLQLVVTQTLYCPSIHPSGESNGWLVSCGRIGVSIPSGNPIFMICDNKLTVKFVQNICYCYIPEISHHLLAK